jgi:hypothetical protein
MNVDAQASNDDYLHDMKIGLSARAVIKAELANFRSSCQAVHVFACEGISDTLIYSHWIAKLCPDLEYEPFICRNKNQLLQLLDSMRSDLNGLSKNVYFLVDRDFDELKGRELTNSVFMTEGYSIENYLVCTNVLSDLLKIELHCHGSVETRSKIISLFEETYENFLNQTTEINFRIYLARKLEIKQIKDLPNRLNEIANVNLDTVGVGREHPSISVQLEREPTESEIVEHKAAFDKLDRRTRYRGKFALLFFTKWLSLLLTERNSNDSKLFSKLPQEGFAGKGPFTFEVLAARSKPSEVFSDFLSAITQKKENTA